MLYVKKINDIDSYVKAVKRGSFIKKGMFGDYSEQGFYMNILFPFIHLLYVNGETKTTVHIHLYGFFTTINGNNYLIGFLSLNFMAIIVLLILIIFEINEPVGASGGYLLILILVFISCIKDTRVLKDFLDSLQ